MSALSDYVRELKRKQAMLEDASDRDDLAVSLICQKDRERPSGSRRVWTRQDKNRLECTIAIEEAESAGRPLLIDIPECNTRQRTRVGWVLGRLEKRSIRPWHQRALDESQRQGTYAVIAPLLVEATTRHKQLIAAYREGTDDWNSVCLPLDEAVANLEMHLIDASGSCQNPAALPVPTSTDRPSPSEHGAEQTPQAFTGGDMVFFADRVELCGVDICSGPRSASRRTVLELLSQKRADGTPIAYGGGELQCEMENREVSATAAGVVRDLRSDITFALRSQSGLVCGRHDVILSGGTGYRFAESVTVHYADPPVNTDITDIDESANVPNVPDDDVPNVRDDDVPNVRDDDVPNVRDEAAARRAWILQQLNNGVQLKAPAVAAHLECSVKTAERDLTTLKDKGRIEYVGTSRTGYYRLCQPPESAQ